MIATIYRDEELIVALNGYPYTIDIDDDRYEAVCEAIDEKDEDALEALLSTRQRMNTMIRDLAADGIEEDGGAYTYKGNAVSMDLSDYLRSAMDAGDAGPIVKFIQRLFKNPSQDTRNRLFMFMEKNKMPITDDGYFLQAGK